MNIGWGKSVYIKASGGFRLSTKDHDDIRIPSAKGAAILAYLAFSDSSHATRDKLASLLWSESSNTAARTSLRQCLYQLKSGLSGIHPDILDIGHDLISLKRSDVATDLDFTDLEADSTQSPDLASVPDPGRLLEGFDHLDESYSEWLRDWRNGVETEIHARLVHQIKSAGVGHGSRLKAAESLNRIDPADEVAARYLIQEQARNSNLAGLLRIYRRLWDTLDEELGEEPSMDLQNFVADIRTKLGEANPDASPIAIVSPTGSIQKRRSYVTIMAVRMQQPKSPRSIDIEEYETLLASYSSVVSKVLGAFGGIVSTGVGNDIVAVFGHPNAAEEDALNALRAALELENQFKSLNNQVAQNLKIGLKIGLDSGLVFIRHIDGAQVLSDLLGTPVDSALTLIQRVETPTILSTERTARRLTSDLEVTAAAPLIDGNEHEPVFSVLSWLPSRVMADIDAIAVAERFVGRSPFLAALDMAWQETKNNGLQIISIVGDPGIGKTHLVGEFLRRNKEAGRTVHLLRCNRYSRSAPLEPMFGLDLALRSGKVLRSKEEVIATDLTEGFSSSDPASPDYKIQPGILADRLHKNLAKEPAIIAFDDWQWADDASRKMLKNLVQKLGKQRLLVVLTGRDFQLHNQVSVNTRNITLSALSENEVVQVTTDILGWQPESAIQNYVFNKSGGNPLFLEEICHAIAHQASVNEADGLADQLPASLQALIVSRMERLSKPLRKIIEAAAVNGDSVQISLLEGVLGSPLDKSTISSLTETNLLMPTQLNEILRFKHGITRDVIYGTVDFTTRKTLHASFATVLETHAKSRGVESIIEQLAMHYRGAGNYERAAYCAERAGDKAKSASSLDLAKTQYAVALEMIDNCPSSTENKRRWLSVAMRWGPPCIYAPSREQLPVFKRAAWVAKELGDIDTMAVINHWIGYITHVIGDHADAVKKLTLAVNIAKDANNQRVMAEAMATRGFANAARCEYPPAEKDIEFAIAAKNQNPGLSSRVPVTSSFARATLAVIKADQGDFERGAALIKEALDRVHGFNHEIESSICNMNAAILLWQGRWDEAKVLAVRSRKRSETVNSPYLIGMARCLYGYSSWRQSGDPKAVEILNSSVERLWTNEMRLYISFAYGWVADACFALGRRDDAYRAAGRTLSLAENGDPIGAAMACRTLAALSAANQSRGLEQALSYLEQSESFAKKRNSPHEHSLNLLHFARIYAAFGNQTAASTHIEQAKPLLTKLGMFWHLERAENLAANLASPSFAISPSQVNLFAL